MTVQGYYNVCRDSVTKQDLPRGLFFDQDWADLKKVMPVASGGIHAGQMHQLIDLFADDVILQIGGGTNGHAVLRQYRPTGHVAAHVADESVSDVHPWREMLVISAQSEPALRALAGRWRAHLRGDGAAASWPLLRANALHRRSHLGHRLVLHAGSAAQAAATPSRVRGAISAPVPPGTARARGRRRHRPVAARWPSSRCRSRWHRHPGRQRAWWARAGRAVGKGARF